jgi:molybdopterin-guanine dinucleotide biosynthesis protein A
LLAYIVERVAPQVGRPVLNANGIRSLRGPACRWSPTRWRASRAAAGVLTGLDWAAAEAPDCPWVASVPGVRPSCARPGGAPARLVAAEDADPARAASRRPSVVGLGRCACATSCGGRWSTRTSARSIVTGLLSAGHRGVSAEPVNPSSTPRPEDLVEAERWLAGEA